MVSDEDDIALENNVCKDLAHVLVAPLRFVVGDALPWLFRLQAMSVKPAVASRRDENFVNGTVVILPVLFTSCRYGWPENDAFARNICRALSPACYHALDLVSEIEAVLERQKASWLCRVVP